MLVGCEPSPVDDYEEMEGGLSVAVRAAVVPAADLVLRLVEELLASDHHGALAGSEEAVSRPTSRR